MRVLSLSFSFVEYSKSMPTVCLISPIYLENLGLEGRIVTEKAREQGLIASHDDL